MADHQKRKQLKREAKNLIKEKLALDELQANQQLMAQLAQQMSAMPTPNGKQPAVIVIYYNDIKTKKKKKKKKAKKSKAAKEKTPNEIPNEPMAIPMVTQNAIEPVATEGDEEGGGTVFFNPQTDGYQTIDAIAIEAYAGIPIVVPVDNKEEPKLPKANANKQPVKGWIRKAPSGVPVFHESKGQAKPIQAVEGVLVRNSNNWNLFAVSGIELDAEGNPVMPVITHQKDGEIAEVKRIGHDVPLSGTIVFDNDGTLQFTKLDLKHEEGNAVIAEQKMPESVQGSVMKDKKTGNLIFVSSDAYGLGGALAAEREAEKKNAEKSNVELQQGVGTVLLDVAKRGDNVETLRANTAKDGEKVGVIIQMTNAPMFVTNEVWESAKRSAISKFPGGKKADSTLLQAEAAKEILTQTTASRNRVLLADQIHRSKMLGKPLDEVQKVDEEERLTKEREIAMERARLLAEHQKFLESRSAFFNIDGQSYDKK